MSEQREIRCHHDDVTLVGRIDLPPGPGPHPAILVMPNANGMGEHVLQVSRQLAEEGYVAITADMHGHGAFYDDSTAAIDNLMPMFRTPGALRTRIMTWFNQVLAQPEVDPRRIAAIGYCMGGQCVLELAREGADLQLVVSFHGTLSTTKPALPGGIKATVAVYNGDDDPYVSRESVGFFEAEMRASGARWMLTQFGGVKHSYTDPDAAKSYSEGNEYDEFASLLTWSGTRSLIKRCLAE